MYTWTEVKNELASLQTAYDSKDYARDRFTSYPTIQDQLDMLYHDIKSGNLNNGKWITAIDAVKERHPKPEFKPE